MAEPNAGSGRCRNDGSDCRLLADRSVKPFPKWLSSWPPSTVPWLPERKKESEKEREVEREGGRRRLRGNNMSAEPPTLAQSLAFPLALTVALPVNIWIAGYIKKHWSEIKDRCQQGQTEQNRKSKAVSWHSQALSDLVKVNGMDAFTRPRRETERQSE